jgi:sulfur relay (sulfurtransferase) DsrC/TusE family protein
VDKLLEYIAKEWGVVSQAPFAFLILGAIMFGLAYLAAKWRYTAVVEQTKSANETLKERLHLKSEQAESYKDRALKYDEKVHSVVDSDEVALKDKTLEVVKNLREYIERYKREDQVNMMERHTSSGQQSEEQRNIEWNKQTNNMMRLSSEMNAEYDRRFRVDTMLLRDELRSRLPDYAPQDRHRDSAYEHPTNYFGFNDVASDLERMAKMLTS